MGKEHIQQTCENKVWYETKDIAKAQAKKYKSAHSTKQRPYRCQYCNGFHLTSKLKMGYKVKARNERRRTRDLKHALLTRDK